jgi:proline dehydrogenase-like protein
MTPNHSDEVARPAGRRFDLSARPQSELRARITAAHREDEKTAVQRLLTQAQMPREIVAAVEGMARRLVTQVRAQRSGSSGVDALMREFSLSSQEGIALMCLAETLLRSPTSKPRTGSSATRSAEATGSRTSAIARRCSSMRPPGAC